MRVAFQKLFEVYFMEHKLNGKDFSLKWRRQNGQKRFLYSFSKLPS